MRTVKRAAAVSGGPLSKQRRTTAHAAVQHDSDKENTDGNAFSLSSSPPLSPLSLTPSCSLPSTDSGLHQPTAATVTQTALTPSSAVTSSAPPPCECGHCPIATTNAVDALCCYEIEPAARLAVSSAPLCERADITAVVRDGVSAADFQHDVLPIGVGGWRWSDVEDGRSGV